MDNNQILNQIQNLDNKIKDYKVEIESINNQLKLTNKNKNQKILLIKKKNLLQKSITDLDGQMQNLIKIQKALNFSNTSKSDEELLQELEEEHKKQLEEERLLKELDEKIEDNPNPIIDNPNPIIDNPNPIIDKPNPIIQPKESKEIELTQIKKTKNQKYGFKQTLKKKPKLTQKSVVNLSNSSDTCKRIFTSGKKLNNNFFIPSQFPNLTRIKSITSSNKKIGGKKTKKRRNNK